MKLSVAIPDSALSDESLKIDKTRKISVLARACAIFKIDTIYIYQDGNNKQDKNLLVMILRYLETPQLYLTDPSGTYISYDAIAIGSGSDQVTDFLEKTYKSDLSIDDASALAAAGIYLSSEDKDGTGHIRMAHIKTETGLYELVSEEQIKAYANSAKEQYPHDKN